MLRLVTNNNAKLRAQALLERNLKASLDDRGVRTIGFPGGNDQARVYSSGKGQLWFATKPPDDHQKTKRFWNAFGAFDPARSAQSIVVETNIASPTNSGRVGAYYATNDEGEPYLVHTGGIGGGRPGIGKEAFLAWTNLTLTPVVDEDGTVRQGVAIAALNDPSLSGLIWRFVQKVALFKEAATSGQLTTQAFRRRLDAFKKYSPEFTGKKKVRRQAPFDYTSYHGAVVDKLYEARSAEASAAEEVFNSTLIDLFVEKSGRVTEIYEVKTSADRQCLYTAIGQLVTHSIQLEGGEARRFLVIPHDGQLPEDIVRATAALNINIRRYRVSGAGQKRAVELII